MVYAILEIKIAYVRVLLGKTLLIHQNLHVKPRNSRYVCRWIFLIEIIDLSAFPKWKIIPTENNQKISLKFDHLLDLVNQCKIKFDQNLYLYILIFQFTTDHGIDPTFNGESTVQKSQLLSFAELTCDIPNVPVDIMFSSTQKGIPVGGFDIRLSNDGTSFTSQSSRFVIYDSKCLICDAASHNCRWKV